MTSEMQLGLVLLHMKHRLLDATMGAACDSCDARHKHCDICQDQIEDEIMNDIREFSLKIGVTNIDEWFPQLVFTGGR